MYTSIHWQSLKEFKSYIKSIINQTLPISDALEMYRELRVMPKKFRQMTVQDLSDDLKLIDELYNALKSGMQPETRFKLGCTTKFREQELIKNLAGRYDIDTVTKAKVITSVYRDNEGRTISYAFECVIAQEKMFATIMQDYEVKFIGNINDSPPSGDRMQYFYEGSYHWSDKQGRSKTARGVGGILYNCGLLYVEETQALRSPCKFNADWVGSAGKTHINLTPYSDVIAETEFGQFILK